MLRAAIRFWPCGPPLAPSNPRSRRAPVGTIYRPPWGAPVLTTRGTPSLYPLPLPVGGGGSSIVTRSTLPPAPGKGLARLGLQGGGCRGLSLVVGAAAVPVLLPTPRGGVGPSGPRAVQAPSMAVAGGWFRDGWGLRRGGALHFVALYHSVGVLSPWSAVVPHRRCGVFPCARVRRLRLGLGPPLMGFPRGGLSPVKAAPRRFSCGASRYPGARESLLMFLRKCSSLDRTLRIAPPLG